MAIYDKSVKELFKELVSDLGLTKDKIITRNDVYSWFREKYPRIKKGTLNAHLILHSTNAPSRIHYNTKSTGEDDLFFQIDGSHFRIYAKETDPAPIYKKDDITEIDSEEDDLDEEVEVSEFAYERDLRNFLSKNLSIIEPGLCLYEDEAVTGVEFPTGRKFIDILAIDKNNNFVVVELKVSKGYERVIGQLLYYLAWIEKNLAEPNQKVRGIIIANNISDDLLLSSSKVPDVELLEYEMSVKFKKLFYLMTKIV